MNKKLLFGVLMICAVAALVGIGTWAYFSDIETSPGNTFTAGTLDLEVTIGSTPVTVIFDVPADKVFPGAEGMVDINLTNAGNIDGIAGIQIVELVDDDNGLTEPEKADGDTTGGPGKGELSAAMDVEILHDSNLDTVFELLVLDTLANMAAEVGPYTIGTLEGGASFPIRIHWSIDFNLVGNEIQSDSCTFSIEFTLMQGAVTPATPEFSNLVTSSSVEQCDETTISVEVKNIGDVAGIFEVPLTITGPSAYLYEASKNTPILDPGASETVEFPWHPSPFMATGTYIVEVDELPTQEIEVVAPTGAAFWLSELAFTPTEPEEGEEVTISVDVWNFGLAAGDKTVDLTITVDIDDTPVVAYEDSKTESSIASDEHRTAEFSWVVGVATDYTVEVGDPVEATLTVVYPSAPPVLHNGAAGVVHVYDVDYDIPADKVAAYSIPPNVGDTYHLDNTFTNAVTWMLPAGTAIAMWVDSTNPTVGGIVIDPSGVLNLPALTGNAHAMQMYTPAPDPVPIKATIAVPCYLTMTDMQYDPIANPPPTPPNIPPSAGRYMDMAGVATLAVPMGIQSFPSMLDLNTQMAVAPVAVFLYGAMWLQMAAVMDMSYAGTQPGWPYTVAETWDSTSLFMVPIAPAAVSTTSVTVAGIDVLDTALGKLVCYKIETSVGSTVVTTSWWSPQVKGTVKTVDMSLYIGVETQELITYIPLPLP